MDALSRVSHCFGATEQGGPESNKGSLPNRVRLSAHAQSASVGSCQPVALLPDKPQRQPWTAWGLLRRHSRRGSQRGSQAAQPAPAQSDGTDGQAQRAAGPVEARWSGSPQPELPQGESPLARPSSPAAAPAHLPCTVSCELKKAANTGDFPALKAQLAASAVPGGAAAEGGKRAEEELLGAAVAAHALLEELLSKTAQHVAERQAWLDRLFSEGGCIGGCPEGCAGQQYEATFQPSSALGDRNSFRGGPAGSRRRQEALGQQLQRRQQSQHGGGKSACGYRSSGQAAPASWCAALLPRRPSGPQAAPRGEVDPPEFDNPLFSEDLEGWKAAVAEAGGAYLAAAAGSICRAQPPSNLGAEISEASAAGTAEEHYQPPFSPGSEGRSTTIASSCGSPPASYVATLHCPPGPPSPSDTSSNQGAASITQLEKELQQLRDLLAGLQLENEQVVAMAQEQLQHAQQAQQCEALAQQALGAAQRQLELMGGRVAALEEALTEAQRLLGLPSSSSQSELLPPSSSLPLSPPQQPPTGWAPAAAHLHPGPAWACTASYSQCAPPSGDAAAAAAPWQTSLLPGQQPVEEGSIEGQMVVVDGEAVQ